MNCDNTEWAYRLHRIWMKRTQSTTINSWIYVKRNSIMNVYMSWIIILDIFFRSNFVKSLYNVSIVKRQFYSGIHELVVSAIAKARVEIATAEWSINACELMIIFRYFLAANISCRSILISYLAGFYIWNIL